MKKILLLVLLGFSLVSQAQLSFPNPTDPKEDQYIVLDYIKKEGNIITFSVTNKINTNIIAYIGSNNIAPIVEIRRDNGYWFPQYATLTPGINVFTIKAPNLNCGVATLDMIALFGIDQSQSKFIRSTIPCSLGPISNYEDAFIAIDFISKIGKVLKFTVRNKTDVILLTNVAALGISGNVSMTFNGRGIYQFENLNPGDNYFYLTADNFNCGVGVVTGVVVYGPGIDLSQRRVIMAPIPCVLDVKFSGAPIVDDLGVNEKNQRVIKISFLISEQTNMKSYAMKVKRPNGEHKPVKIILPKDIQVNKIYSAIITLQ